MSVSAKACAFYEIDSIFLLNLVMQGYEAGFRLCGLVYPILFKQFKLTGTMYHSIVKMFNFFI